MPRLPFRFVRCLDCSHIFNPVHDARHLQGAAPPPASDAGAHVRGQMLVRLPAHPVVIEVGHGDGALLEALAAARPGRYIGFDPEGAEQPRVPGVEFRRAPFWAPAELGALRPDLIISRRTAWSGDAPALADSLSFAAAAEGLAPLVYLEVPCVDRALEAGRVEDFYYARHSNFTTASFSRFLARVSGAIEAMDHTAGGESIYALFRLEARTERYEQARRAKAFAETSSAWRHVLMLELANLYLAGKRIAIWGGTAGAAAFLNVHHMDAQRFPLVVDSDAAVVDRYVPGTGQRIQPCEVLREKPADVLLIPCPGRAPEIAAAMTAMGIRAGQMLVPREGRLEEYQTAGQNLNLDRATELILAAG